MRRSRRGSYREFFHHFQANHFAGNFGEAFDPADDLDETFVIELNDIASFIPAFAGIGSGRLQHTRLCLLYTSRCV